MCNNENKCCVSIDIYKQTLEKLIWSVCLNYASEQISIGKACELLSVTSDEFKKIFETFPYGNTTKDNCRWLTG